jgi:hypothetical protein
MNDTKLNWHRQPMDGLPKKFPQEQVLPENPVVCPGELEIARKPLPGIPLSVAAPPPGHDDIWGLRSGGLGKGYALHLEGRSFRIQE